MQNINRINSVFNNYVSLLDKDFNDSSEMEIENEIKEELSENEENKAIKKMILQKIK